MIYDCFLINSELDLLALRLQFLDDVVDRFVIVESPRTLSGNEKPLYFQLNKQQFAKYESKIIHLVAPVESHLNAWEYEYFQRNYIKEGLKNCADNDIVLIGDVDEIVNLKAILQKKDLALPALVELPVYYYFINLKSAYKFAVNLLCHYSFIKDKYIGERNATYPKYVDNVIRMNEIKTGWHFSFLFGLDIPRYQEKIKSFSHQEYNTPFFLEEKRLLKCVQLGIDLFERTEIIFLFKNPQNDCRLLLPSLEALNMGQLVYRPSLSVLLRPGYFSFLIRKKTIPVIVKYIYKRPLQQLIRLTAPLRKLVKKMIGRA